MRRLTLPEGALASDRLQLPSDAVHYVQHVLRMAVGDPVELTDGAGVWGEGRFEAMSRATVEVSVLRRWTEPSEPGPPVHLVQALAKADKMDQVVRMAAELGAASFTPLHASRSVAKRSKAGPRWERIAEDALRVAGGRRMALRSGLDVDGLTQTLGTVWVLDARGRRTLADAMAGDAPESLTLVVGPEGGFGPEERQRFQAAGFQLIRLGPRNLRTETAGPAALAALRLVGWGVRARTP